MWSLVDGFLFHRGGGYLRVQYWDPYCSRSISMTSQRTSHLSFVCLPMTVYFTDVIKSTRDCEQLRRDVNRPVKWLNKWLMKFNFQKCTSMSEHRLRSRFQDYIYKMNDVALARPTQQRYLEVVLTSDLRWTKYISNRVSKAIRLLRLVNRS